MLMGEKKSTMLVWPVSEIETPNIQTSEHHMSNLSGAKSSLHVPEFLCS